MKITIIYKVDDIKQALLLLKDHTYWIKEVHIETQLMRAEENMKCVEIWVECPVCHKRLRVKVQIEVTAF